MASTACIVDRGRSLVLSHRSVPETFFAVATQHASALALQGMDISENGDFDIELTYHQLTGRVAKAAAQIPQGGGFQSMVALFIEEAVPLVIAMLAVLWAGRAFVPIDLAHWPRERCQVVIEISGAASAFARRAQRQKVEELVGEMPVLWYEEISAGEGAVQPHHDLMPADLCYAIFTSGSTGRPKCVLCEHQSALAYSLAKAKVEELGPGGRQLLASHFTFDPAQGDVFGALCSGATLLAPSRAAVLGALQEVLQGMRVSHATMTPTQWALRAAGDLPDLQHLTLCGEPMRKDTIDVWAKSLALRNMYGVTEATGVQTFHRMRPADPPKLVGKALPGYVLAMTEDGEVLVAGQGLARGYLGLPEETARCFVPWHHGNEAFDRVYRTGDLAFWSDESGLELRGRKDHQVKISGVRVESFEIESAVEASGLVANCTCILQHEKLVAHCVLPEGSHMDWVLRAALEAHAAKRLPMQVVPHFFVAHEKLPVAPGGKVDRQALMASDLNEEPDLEPLETALEDAVAAAWAEVLKRPKASMGANSNFLWFGGDSLAALRACRQLAEEVTLPKVDQAVQEQLGEAGLMVSAEAPEGAVCVLSAALGPLAPCELLARPMLRQYASFLAAQNVQPKSSEGGERPESTAAATNETGTLPELALVAAAGDGREDVVRVLLEVANPNGPARGQPPRGQAPLLAAAAAGHAGCARLLLAAKANVRAMTSSTARTSAAHLAAARGDSEILQLLLTDRGPEGVATWARDVDMQTVLHLAARSGDVKSLELVLSRVKGLKAKDGGLEAKDRWGRTALQWAVANGHQDVAVCLIRAGAFTKNLPEALLEDLQAQVNLTTPSRPGQPLAARKVVQSAERIQALVESLPKASGVPEEREVFALTALRDFCCGAKEHRDAAVVAGALPKLLHLLDAPEEVSAAAAQTLRNIAADRSGAQALQRAGGIGALVSLAQSGGPAAWRAASALANLAEFQELLVELREAGTVGVLQRLGGQIPSSLQ